MAIRTFCTFIALSVLAASAAAQSLSLGEAQRRAVERSLQLAGQDAAVVASREMAVAAGQLPDPVLKLGIDNLPIDGPDRFSVSRDFMTMRRIGVSQEFTRGTKRALRSERFEREADKSLAEKAARLAAIQRDTALAWLDRYYVEAMAAVIAEQSREAGREIIAAEGAYRGGRGSQADLIAAHAARVALEDKASELRRRISVAKINLTRWMGDGADLPLADKPRTDTVHLDANNLEAHLLLHPQIEVLARQEEVAAAEVRIAQANKTVDWSVEFAYQQRGPLYSNMVSIGVAIPIQWDQRNRQDREVAAKLALAQQAKAEREEALRAHVGEVRAMIAEWQNDKERVSRYVRELVPLSRERTRASLAAYSGGKATLAELLLARRNEIDVRLQTIQLESETARLWAQLEYLMPEAVQK